MKRRRCARATLTSAVVLFFGFTLAYSTFLQVRDDFGDPECSRKLAALERTLHREATRPLVVVLGSSRVAYGVNPQAWEEEPSSSVAPKQLSTGLAKPLVFNLGLVGSGPIMQRLMLHRLLRRGVRPSVVVVEFWPPFLREDGPYHEAARLDPARLGLHDETLIRRYFPDAQATWKTMIRRRWNPWVTHSEALLSRTLPRWMPTHRRTDSHWKGLTEWGYLPGREQVTPAERCQARQNHEAYYQALFSGYQVHPVADLALRDLVVDAAAHQFQLYFCYLPETEHFRSRMPPETVQAARHYEQHLRTTMLSTDNIGWIDARDWVTEDDLPDGFHMLAPAAKRFTVQLMKTIEARRTTATEAEVTRQ